MQRTFSDWLATFLMLVAVPVLTVAMASAAMAAKPSSSVWVEELSGPTALATAQLEYGDAFTVGYSTSAREPWALTECYANDTTQLAGSLPTNAPMWAEYFSAYPGGPVPQAFVLGDSVTPVWVGGGADCTVTLLKFSGDFSRETLLATTRFAVAP